MRPTFLSVLCAVALIASPAAAKKSADHDRRVACNKGWGLYKEQHSLKGHDRKAYLADCLSGKIEPPVRVPGTDKD